MSNKSYLCCTDYPEICPHHDYAGYDSSTDVFASGVYCVPLIWLAVFPESCLQRKALHVPAQDGYRLIDGKREPVQIPACDVEVIAPISLRIDSLERLSKGIGSLESLLNVDRRTLSGHEACFRELLENGDGRYLTIELEEIACIVDPEVFYSHLAELLRFFDGSNSETARDAWRSLAELDLTRPIISPKDFDERPDLTTEDYRNLENLLGSSYIRPTTWPE